MLFQLLLGTCVISGTVLIQVLFISTSMKALTHYGHWIVNPPKQYKTAVVLVLLVLWMVAGLSISAWLWAAVFLGVGAFDQLEPALYFSVVTFTTLGYGDITLDKNWRLIGSLAAVNGLIIVGLITAYLVEVITRIRRAQLEKMESH